MTTPSEEDLSTGVEDTEYDAAAEKTDGDETVHATSDDADVPTDRSTRDDAIRTEVALRDERVTALEEHVTVLERELASTVSRYRLALLDTAPEVPSDLVSGDSAEELETSLAKARAVVEQVRARLMEGMESAGQAAGSGRNASEQGGGSNDDAGIGQQPFGGRIPAGAPPRSLEDGSADLSARDKIALGLERL